MKTLGWVYFKLLLGTFFWGLNFHWVQITMTSMDEWTGSAARYLVSGIGILLLFPIVGGTRITKEEWIKSLRNFHHIILVCLFGIFFFNYFFFKGLAQTHALNGALFVALNPVFTAIISKWMLGVKLSRMQWSGIIIALFGVVVVLTEGNPNKLLQLKLNTGDLWVLGSSVLFAVHNVWIHKYLPWIQPLLLTFLTNILGAVLFLAVSYETDFGDLLPQLPQLVIISVVVMGFLGTTLSFLFWNTGVKELGATKTSVFLNLVPLFAGVSGLFFGHSISLFQIIGGTIILIGIRFSSLKRKINA